MGPSFLFLGIIRSGYRSVCVSFFLHNEKKNTNSIIEIRMESNIRIKVEMNMNPSTKRHRTPEPILLAIKDRREENIIRILRTKINVARYQE